MQNRKFRICDLGFVILSLVVINSAYSVEYTDGAMDSISNIESEMDTVASDAIAQYDISGSLFEQITELEQEKVLMQLERERAQLDLELDRLAAEKIKLHLEIDTLSGRADEQKAELESARIKLEQDQAKLEQIRNAPVAGDVEQPVQVVATADNAPETPVSEKYKLINIVGVGGQLQATIENVSNAQRKKISVGKLVDGYEVKSISANDGIVFDKDGVSETLSAGGR